MRLLDMLCVPACCRFSVVAVFRVPYFSFGGGDCTGLDCGDCLSEIRTCKFALKFLHSIER